LSFIKINAAARIIISLKKMMIPNHKGKLDLIINARTIKNTISLSARGSRIFPNSVSWDNFLAR
jgi:hypothetical protein